MNLPQLTLQLLVKPTSASGRPDAAPLVLSERDLPGQGAPVFLKAQPGVVYNLVDKQTGRVVAAQTTRRKDKHLEVEFEGRSVLVVQDFYETDAALGPESLHLAAQADDTLDLSDLSAYGEQWANWDQIFGGDDVLTADLSSPAAGTAVGSGPTVAPATSVSTTAGSATSSAVGSAVSAVPAVGITGVTGTAVAPVTGVASSVGAASGLGGLIGGVAAVAGAAALGGRDSSAAASQGPIATVLSLGTGVANGATSAEATAAGGVLTVVAQASASVAVTFTGQSGSVTKTVTGNGATPVAVVLLNSDLTTLGQGSVSVSAVTTGVTGTTTTTFILDTAAPNAPTLTSVTDNHGLTLGTLNAGDSTDDNTPTLRYSLSGSQAVAGDRIQLYNGVTALGSAQVLTQTDIVNGFVDVTPSALYAGQYSFNAKLIDAAGNESTAGSSRSQTLLITADQRLQGEPGEDDGYWNQAQDRPDLDMARLSDGGYVIAWSGLDTANGNAEAIYLQRYNAQNQAMGGPVGLNTMFSGQDVLPQMAALPNGRYVLTWTDGVKVFSMVRNQDDSVDLAHYKILQGATSNASGYPQVLELASGGYVLAWQGTTTDGHAADVYVRAFRADGTALGVEHRLSTGLGASDGIPALAALSDGGYLVSWSGAGGSDIFVQRYDNQSDDSGYSRVQLSGVGATSNVNPSIAVLADDGYVLTWEGNVAGAGREVFTQRFDENDAPVDPAQRMQVAPGSNNDTFIPKVAALSDGGYVLVWNEQTNNGQDYDIFIQRFDVNNAAVGDGHRVAHAAGEDDYQPNVLALPNGGYVIAWTGLTAGNFWFWQDIYVQQYGADDEPISAPQRLQGLEGDFEDWGMPALLGMADGGYVVSWMGDIDNVPGYDIFAQRFDAMGLPVL